MPLWTRKSPTYTDTDERSDMSATRQRILTKVGRLPDLRDRTTSLVSHAWFFHKSTQDALRKYFWALPRYKVNAWDCENFSVELVQWVCKEATKCGGFDASPAIWVNCVYNKVPFAGVRDGNHALNLLETDEGDYAIEPQSIRNRIEYIEYSKYANASFDIYQ